MVRSSAQRAISIVSVRSFWIRSREASFREAKRKRFRLAPLKSLKSLMGVNQPFRRFPVLSRACSRFRFAEFARSSGEACLTAKALSRRVEAAEPVFHLVDFVAHPLKCRPEPQAVRREAVQMVEDADESMRSRRFARVDLGPDQLERPLEPRDLHERKIVGGIGVAAIELLADDLLDTAEAEGFRGRNGAHRLPAHEAGENPLRAVMLLGEKGDRALRLARAWGFPSAKPTI